MKTSLSDITMKDYVSLMCGDTSVLLEPGENATDDELKNAASELAYRYRAVVSPGSAEAALMEKEEEVKVKSRLLLTGILRTMSALGDTDGVRSILAEVGHAAEGDVVPVLDSMRAECLYLLKRAEDARPVREEHTPEEIREMYDAESAALMTFFRMQINLSEISAGVYANMLRQAEEQTKRMRARG